MSGENAEQSTEDLIAMVSKLYYTLEKERTTLRDRIAMAALGGLIAGLASDEIYQAEQTAKAAYELADAMLAARSHK